MQVLPSSIPNLVSQAMLGSQKAYAQLYQAHVEVLFRFMLQFAGSREQTADWVQAAFVKAFLNLEKFSGRSSFKTWLFQIAINEMKMGLRSLQTEIESFDEALHSEEAAEGPMLSNDLKFWVNKLDTRHKLVLLLIEAEGYSHAETAVLLGISESGSRTLLSRAKSRLKTLIKKEGSYGTP